MADITHNGLIIHDVPPNWGLIKSNFRVTEESRVLYAYAPHVYSPVEQDIPFMLVAHEKVHIDQQQRYDGGVDAWWQRYCDDMQFRLSQELAAHRAEYRSVCDQPECNRAMRRTVLKVISKKLASPLYGCMIPRKVAAAVLPMCDDPEVVARVVSGEYNEEEYD